MLYHQKPQIKPCSRYRKYPILRSISDCHYNSLDWRKKFQDIGSVDLHHVDADPNPAFTSMKIQIRHFNADPDPTTNFDADQAFNFDTDSVLRK
jgi:hypothetical protein